MLISTLGWVKKLIKSDEICWLGFNREISQVFMKICCLLPFIIHGCQILTKLWKWQPTLICLWRKRWHEIFLEYSKCLLKLKQLKAKSDQENEVLKKRRGKHYREYYDMTLYLNSTSEWLFVICSCKLLCTAVENPFWLKCDPRPCLPLAMTSCSQFWSPS